MTTYQKAAAWVVVQALFAGCSGGQGPSTSGHAPTSGTPAPAPAPDPVVHITRQPVNVSVAAGSAATFSVQVDDIGAAFQWMRNGAPISGAVRASYTTAATTAADNGATFTVVVTNAEGTVTSTAATLTVISASPPTPSPSPTPTPAPAPTPTPSPGPAPTPTPTPTPAPAPAAAPTPLPAAPTITVQPANQTVPNGATGTFSVTATGSNLSYQWKRNNTDIAGATAASYTTPAVGPTDNGAVFTVAVSNAGGQFASNGATLTTQSADQLAAETFSLAPAAGVYELDWYLNYVGAQTPANSYWLVYDFATYTASPLTGPQNVTQQPEVQIATTLGTPPVAPTRVLKNGAILVVPDRTNSFKVSYVGNSVQVDNLAQDGVTVAYSQLRSNYSITSLSGTLHSAPAQITNPYNSIFANPLILDTTTTWASGAAYMIYTARNLGDRYLAFDCHATTTDANISPCQAGTTLAAAMTAGETSTSDATTYHTADGTMTTLGGVPVWVANVARRGGPSGTAAFTTEYRIYFELNGNVYTGSLIKDGAVMSTHHYRTNPNDQTTTVYLNYEMRLNLPAINSLRAASLL